LATLTPVPELPEVESYRRLAEAALGRAISKVFSPDPWYLKGAATASSLRGVLVGHHLVAARRIGKLLLLEVDAGPVVGIRFGMTGNLVVDGRGGVDQMHYAPRRRDPAWDRWSLGLEDGGSLVVHDPRRLGGISLDPDLARLGPDALSLTPAQLAGALRGSRAPLKARLLDQSRVAGVGNLIADEVLWRAGLSPLRSSDSLTTNERRRLHRNLAGTLSDLIRQGGSHTGRLMDQRHPGGRCPKDGTELTRSTVGGRTSFWCAVHQN
jgi:formamidopyrimidine-DNA glycosylase